MPVVRATLARVIGTSEAEYTVVHTTDGRKGTRLEFGVNVVWSACGGGEREFYVRWPSEPGGAAADSPQAAVERMGAWLTRAGEALRELAPLFVGSSTGPLMVVLDSGSIVYGRDGHDSGHDPSEGAP